MAPPTLNLAGGSFNDDSAVRPGMEALNALAPRAGCLILFVHHWNKDTHSKVQYRQGGSGAFAQVVRHRVTMYQHDTGPGAFAVTKSNIETRGHVHGYTVAFSEDYFAPYLVMGQPEDAPSLDKWIAAIEKADSASGMAHLVDPHVLDCVRALPPGPISVRDVALYAGASLDHIKAALAQLQTEGVIVRTQKGGWKRC